MILYARFRGLGIPSKADFCFPSFRECISGLSLEHRCAWGRGGRVPLRGRAEHLPWDGALGQAGRACMLGFLNRLSTDFLGWWSICSEIRAVSQLAPQAKGFAFSGLRNRWWLVYLCISISKACLLLSSLPSHQSSGTETRKHFAVIIVRVRGAAVKKVCISCAIFNRGLGKSLYIFFQVVKRTKLVWKSDQWSHSG